LGLEAFTGINKEHWTRIKALARRIQGEWNEDAEYLNLKPLASYAGNWVTP